MIKDSVNNKIKDVAEINELGITSIFDDFSTGERIYYQCDEDFEEKKHALINGINNDKSVKNKTKLSFIKRIILLLKRMFIKNVQPK